MIYWTSQRSRSAQLPHRFAHANQNDTANTRARQSGLTLVELLVAMTIGLFMLIAIGLVYSTSKTGFSYAANTVRMSEDASFALDMMGRDIRMAGYAGCTGSNVQTLPTIPPVDMFTPKLDLVDSQTVSGNQKPNPFSGVIGGNLLQIFTSRNAVWGFAPNDSGALGVLGGSLTSYSPSTTNPILYLAGGSSQAMQVQAAVAAPGDAITISADTYRWGNNPNSTFMIISDCKGSEMFRADSVSASGSVVRISHAATANDSADLSNTYGADSIVTPLVTSVYFLATRAGTSTPSLYRRSFNGSVADVEELIPNVSAIAFHYGVNTSNTPTGDPTFRADSYVTDATLVTDWSRVVSVRMGLILASEDLGKAAVAGQNVTWLDGTFTPPNDSRLRRAYSTTVSIRNRMGL